MESTLVDGAPDVTGDLGGGKVILVGLCPFYDASYLTEGLLA